MIGEEDKVAANTSASSDEIYPYLQQMRHSFNGIIRILQNDERCVRDDWEMVQRERDRVTRVLSAIYHDRTPLPSSSAVTPVRQRVAVPLAWAEDSGTSPPGISSPPARQEREQFATATHSKGLRSDVLDIASIPSSQWRLRQLPAPQSPGAADAPGTRGVSGILSPVGQAHGRAVPPLAKSVSERTFWIHVWPCFGTFAASSPATARPVRLFVPGNYCYMEQLTERAGAATGCRPAPSVLYEPDGRPIRALRHLTPEQHYLLFPSGGLYRREAVPEVLLKELVRAARSTLARRADAE